MFDALNDGLASALEAMPRRCENDGSHARFAGAEARAKVLAANTTFCKPPTRNASITLVGSPSTLHALSI
jgi:hypothetical protein